MEIAATISPITPHLAEITLARANGAFGTFDQIAAALAPYKHIPTLLDIPHGRRKTRTNSYSDQELVDFAKKNGITYVAVSYVNSPDDLIYDHATCAKIETAEGYKNIDAIAKAADLLLIDRRDLATAIGMANVPEAVHAIVAAAHCHGKKVIIASEFLLSMTHHNAEPTISEAHDVFSAHKLGADYLMLAEETALSKNPVFIVQMAKSIMSGQSEKHHNA